MTAFNESNYSSLIYGSMMQHKRPLSTLFCTCYCGSIKLIMDISSLPAVHAVQFSIHIDLKCKHRSIHNKQHIPITMSICHITRKKMKCANFTVICDPHCSQRSNGLHA